MVGRAVISRGPERLITASSHICANMDPCPLRLPLSSYHKV